MQPESAFINPPTSVQVGWGHMGQGRICRMTTLAHIGSVSGSSCRAAWQSGAFVNKCQAGRSSHACMHALVYIVSCQLWVKGMPTCSTGRHVRRPLRCTYGPV